MPKLSPLEIIQSATLEEKQAWIQSLSEDELDIVYEIPELFLYNKQIAPQGNWRYHMFRAGRGSGKTYASTSWLYRKILEGAKEVAIMGPDFRTVWNEIVPIFMSHFPQNKQPLPNTQLNLLRIPNSKTIVKLYTSEQEVRGANLEYAVAEEICKWCDSIPDKIQERFDLLDFAVRVGKNPQIFIASTPKPFQFFVQFEEKALKDKNPLYSMVIGTMFDNPHLPDSAKQALLEKYGKTRIGRQEIYAELLTDVPGALWTYSLINYRQLSDKDTIIRTVIAVDPAVSKTNSSDETGIICAATVKHDNNAYSIYILGDYSGKYTPNEWANKVNELYYRYNADRIVVEKNQGGDLVISNLKTVNSKLPVKAIHASKGKILRAEPIAALYEQQKVYHIEPYQELETEMTTFTGDARQSSPNRLDAMVYALSELALEYSAVPRNISALPSFY